MSLNGRLLGKESVCCINGQSLLLFSAQLHDRIAKIDRLRKRYEILMVSMAPPEGEEEHSQTYYVIKVFSLFFAFDLSLSLSLSIYPSLSYRQLRSVRRYREKVTS